MKKKIAGALAAALLLAACTGAGPKPPAAEAAGGGPVPMSFLIKEQQRTVANDVMSWVSNCLGGNWPNPSGWNGDQWRVDNQAYHWPGNSAWVRFAGIGAKTSAFDPALSEFVYGKTSIISQTDGEIDGTAYLLDNTGNDDPLKFSQDETVTLAQERTTETSREISLDIGAKTTGTVGGDDTGAKLEQEVSANFGIKTDESTAESESKSTETTRHIETEVSGGKAALVTINAADIQSSTPFYISGVLFPGVTVAWTDYLWWGRDGSPRSECARALLAGDGASGCGITEHPCGWHKVEFDDWDDFASAASGRNVKYPRLTEAVVDQCCAHAVQWHIDNPDRRAVRIDGIQRRNYQDSAEVKVADVTGQDLDQLLKDHGIADDHHIVGGGGPPLLGSLGDLGGTANIALGAAGGPGDFGLAVPADILEVTPHDTDGGGFVNAGAPPYGGVATRSDIWQDGDTAYLVEVLSGTPDRLWARRIDGSLVWNSVTEISAVSAPDGVLVLADQGVALVVNDADDKVYAFELRAMMDGTATRDSDWEFDLATGNDDPKGICANGNLSRLWVLDGTDTRAYGYDGIGSGNTYGEADSGANISFTAANDHPIGCAVYDVTVSGTRTERLMVLDSSDTLAYAYNPANRTYASGNNVDLSTANGDAIGISYSADLDRLFVGDQTDERFYAYERDATADGGRSPWVNRDRRVGRCILATAAGTASVTTLESPDAPRLVPVLANTPLCLQVTEWRATGNSFSGTPDFYVLFYSGQGYGSGIGRQ